MKVIVAGSRTIANRGLIVKAMTDSGFQVDEAVCGCARGVDTEAAFIAKMRGIPVKEFPADWDLYGKRAGYIRNAQMALWSEAKKKVGPIDQLLETISSFSSMFR